MSDLKPVDLKTPVSMIIRFHPGEWLSPADIWRELQRLAPEEAARVQEKIQTYQDPERNNAVWFITNTFSYLDPNEFERSNTEQVPEMKRHAYWEIIRKRP